MTAYVIADDCVPQDLYLCVRDQCSRTVASVKAKLHLMLRPYYILTGHFGGGLCIDNTIVHISINHPATLTASLSPQKNSIYTNCTIIISRNAAM